MGQCISGPKVDDMAFMMAAVATVPAEEVDELLKQVQDLVALETLMKLPSPPRNPSLRS